MEKENKEITATDIAAVLKDDKWSSDSLWIFLLFMMFWGFPPSYDTKTREELAELKGKVAVLEKLAVRGN